MKKFIENLGINKFGNSAVVLGLGVNGLGVVRALGCNKVKIVGIYTSESEPGRFSKYCKALKLPQLKIDKEGFIRGLKLAVEDAAIKPVLIPTSDEYVQFISDNREILSDLFLFILPSKDILNQLNNKEGMKYLAEKANVPIPQTYIFNDIKALYANIHKLKFPCIIKPKDTFSCAMPGNGKNRTFNNADSLLSFMNSYPAYIRNAVFQEIKKSGDGNIYQCFVYFDKTGRYITSATIQKIRQYPPDFGIMCFGRSMSIPALKTMSRQFLESVHFKGIAFLEYAFDGHNYYFIEINNRISYYNSMLPHCNVNPAFMYFLDAIGEPIDVFKSIEQKDEVYWLDFAKDIGSFSRKNRERKTILKNWASSIFKSRAFAVFTFDDILPFFYSSILFLRVVFSKFRTLS
ncbi:MAG: hypothetical protein KAJ10_10275 [Thermodesulfovibrionia bacterium]|nr:hypothetical protein [Thermodesulfovibrionia bacterium]